MALTNYNFTSLAIFGTLILLTTFLIILTFSFLYINPYSVRENNNILRNWNQTLILDIVLAKDKCPFMYEPILLGYTNRVVRGMKCGSNSNRGFNYNGETFDGLYKYYDYTTGCNSISERSAEPIYVWKNSLICALRSKKYHELVKVYAYESCGSLLRCPHPIDTMNNFICVRHYWECGINYLKVLGQNEDYDKTKFKKLDFFDGSGSSLLIGRLQPGLPSIAELKVIKGAVCAYPQERSQFQNQSYILYESFQFNNGCSTRIMGHKTNPYFKLVDSISEEKMLRNLNMLTNFQNLPIYPVNYLTQQDLNLYQSTFVGFQKHCKVVKSDMSYFLEDPIFDAEIVDGGFAGVVSMLFIILGFALIALFAYGCRERDKKDCHCASYVFLSMSFICLFIIAWVYYSYYTTRAFYKYLNDAYLTIGRVCFDDFHQNLLIHQNEASNYFANFYVVIGIWSTFMLFSICAVPAVMECFKNNCDFDSNDDD